MRNTEQKLEALNEVKEIVLALRDRQEETDAKLEAPSMNIHKVPGNITALQEDMTSVKNTLSNIKDKLEFTSPNTYQNEAEIFKLRTVHIE